MIYSVRQLNTDWEINISASVTLLTITYCSPKFNKHKILCVILYDLFKASNCVRDEDRLKN